MLWPPHALEYRCTHTYRHKGKSMKGSTVKCTECASRGPSPHMAAYTSVTLVLQGSSALSWPPWSICTHVACRLTSRQNAPPYTHTHTQIRKKLKSQSLSLDGLELPSASRPPKRPVLPITEAVHFGHLRCTCGILAGSADRPFWLSAEESNHKNEKE